MYVCLCFLLVRLFTLPCLLLRVVATSLFVPFLVSHATFALVAKGPFSCRLLL